MKLTSTGNTMRWPISFAFFPVLIGAALLAGCARVTSAPLATSPADIVAPVAPAAPPVEPGPDEPAPPEAATMAETAVPDAVPEAESEDDSEPAEEVEPSPLDELPETVPEVSDSVLARDKALVAEAFPGFDMPMVLNDQVVRYVEYFSNRHKAFFELSLARSGRYVETFQSIFEQAGIPKDLVFMAHVESAFKTNAYSRAKAKGIFQFIAGTGRRYGLRIDGWVDERSDPEKSARAAAAYLKDLYGMFGDWYLALAAYNAGEGKIQRSLAQTRKNDFWSLASTRSLRSETRNYVPAILAATLIAKQPEKFGFDVRPDAPLASDVVRIDGQTDLRILARLAGADPDALKQLNPHLRRGVTPPHAVTDVRVPAGLGELTGQAYAALPASDRMVLTRHHVEKGESLGVIARRYGVTATAISHANRLGKNPSVRPGQELVIPAVAGPAPELGGSRAHGGTYRVRAGDTLYEIARRHRTSPSAIAAANRIGVHAFLRVGQRLVIPGRASNARVSVPAAPKGGTAAASAVVHTVRRGENLYRIADRYQVTVDQICALNSITRGGVLYPGTRLKIRTN